MVKKLDAKKKMMIAGSVAVIMIIVLIGVIYANQSKTHLELKKEAVTVEYGNTISTDAKDYLSKDVDKDIIKKTKVTSKVKNEKDKEYPAVGSYKVTLTYEDEKATVEVKVKDTVKPKFNTCDSIEVLKDGMINYAYYIKAEDLSEVKVAFEDKEVNLAIAGEYTLKATAIDSSKNKATKDVKVVVKEVDMANNDVTVETDEKGNVVLKITEKVIEQNNIVSSSGGNTPSSSRGSSTGEGYIGGNASSNGGSTSSGTTQPPAQEPCYTSTYYIDCWGNKCVKGVDYIYDSWNWQDCENVMNDYINKGYWCGYASDILLDGREIWYVKMPK